MSNISLSRFTVSFDPSVSKEKILTDKANLKAEGQVYIDICICIYLLLHIVMYSPSTIIRSEGRLVDLDVF